MIWPSQAGFPRPPQWQLLNKQLNFSSASLQPSQMATRKLQASTSWRVIGPDGKEQMAAVLDLVYGVLLKEGGAACAAAAEIKCVAGRVYSWRSWCTSVKPCTALESYSWSSWCTSEEAAAGSVGAQTETADSRLQLEWYMGDREWCSCCVL